MDSEQRVKALEQELQILKEEIQVLLLDIQQQILSSTYPGLRSGDISPQGNKTAGVQPPKIEDEERPVSPVRKMNSKAQADYEDAAPQRSSRNQGNRNSIDWEMMADLEEWASEKLEALGVEKTVELIHNYAAKGRFPEEAHEALLEFVEFQNGLRSTPPPSPRRPSPAAGVPQPNPARKAPVIARPTVQPAAPAPRQQPVAVPQPKPNQSKPKSPKTAKPEAQVVQPRPAPAPAEPSAKPRKAADESSQGLVLRLIAGMQNAGAGIRWGKGKT